MKRIDIKLSLPVVAPIIDTLQPIAETLKDELAAPMHLEDLDPDFREFWREELLQGQQAEVKGLLDLFNDEFFSTGVISLDEGNATAALRAAAALRLRVRTLHWRAGNSRPMICPTAPGRRCSPTCFSPLCRNLSFNTSDPRSSRPLRRRPRRKRNKKSRIPV